MIQPRPMRGVYRRGMTPPPPAPQQDSPIAIDPGTQAGPEAMADDGTGYPGTAPYVPAQVQYPGYQRYVGNNSDDMIANDRSLALGRGDEQYQQAKDRAANESQVKENYRAYGDEVYDPLIGGRGGYTADQAAKIDRSDELNGVTTTDQEFQDNYLTPEEGQGMTGNPWDRAAYFNPDASSARQDESAARQRGVVDDLKSGMYESLDGQLGMSDEYAGGVDRTLDSADSRVRGAYDPAALKANGAALDRIRMTPEEEQDIVTKAGISGGMKYHAAADDMDARARAAGLNPLGAAALRSRYLRNANADAADAMTDARVAASNARSGREATAEDIRMGGEKSAATLGSQNELALANQRLNAATTKEGVRLGAQRDIATRRADVAKTVGQQALNTEQGINDQQRQVDQYNTNTGTTIATGIEKDAADRAAQIAANRQKTAQTNQNTKFQQGYQRVGASSNMGQTVADATRADAKEGRGYITGQNTQANSNSQNEYNREANIYATQGQLTQGTTQNQLKKDSQPKWWEKVLAAGAQAAGAFAGGG
jgi:hypothetical protein